MRLLLILATIFFLSTFPLNSEQSVYTHGQALALVQAAGISLHSTANCNNRAHRQCTSLDGLHSEAIDGIITLKKASGCPIVITGGTETGHGWVGPRSHSNGWKIDIRKLDCVTRYIKSTFTSISGRRWRSALGNIYYEEKDHFDIQYGNARGRRSTNSISDCLQCICEVESSCRPIPCSWDINSNSCGYFQIKKDYFIDCYTPGRRAGESINQAWKRCASDYDCSVECIQNYVNRYGHRCSSELTFCERAARLHNGGPNGCRKSATSRYWGRVFNCLY